VISFKKRIFPKRFFSGRDRGFTLVELLVALGILAIVISAVYGIFISQLRSKVWQDQMAEMQQNLRGGMDVMVNDLLDGQDVLYVAGICNTVISVRVDDDKNGTLDTVTYDTITKAPQPADAPTTVLSLRRTRNAETPIIVADNVTNFKVNCYNQSGQYMSGVTASSVGDVRKVEFSLTTMTSKKNPNTGSYFEKTLASSIEMRNIWQVSGSGCGLLGFTLDRSTIAFCNPPGEKGNITIEIADLEGNPLSGTVQLYPKVPLPLSITGTNVSLINGIATMDIGAGGSGYAVINATNPSGIPAGTGIEMVARWQPAGCSYAIAVARSLSVKAGDPKHIGLANDPTTIKTCASGGCGETSTFTATVADNCTNPMKGQTVDFTIESGGGEIAPAFSNTGSDGNASTVYTPPDLLTTPTAVIKAADAAIEPEADRTATASVTMTTCDPAQFELLSGSPITKDECPNNQSLITFKIKDKCGNVIQEDQTAKLTPSANRGTLRNPNTGIITDPPIVFNSGDYTYSTNYWTPDACGNGGDYTATISHQDIAPADNLSIPVTLNKCPAPGVNLNVSTNSLAAGCPGNTAIVTATILKNTCEPDPVPASMTFEVRDVQGGNSYGDTGGRNGRFAESGSASYTKGVAPYIATLNAGDAIEGDELWVRGRANIEAYGGAEYTSNEFKVDIAGSTASGDFYTDATYLTVATYYDVPTPAQPKSVYIKIEDCDANLSLSMEDTITGVTLSTERTADSETLTLTETGNNTGVFTGQMEMRNNMAEAVTLGDGLLTVLPGDRVSVVHAEFFKSIYLTGCREMQTLDKLGAVITSVQADRESITGTYTAGYPDGANSFHLKLNLPALAGDSSVFSSGDMWGRVHVCASDPAGEDEDKVNIKEEAGDTGILNIDASSYGGTRDWIYVAGDVNNIAPTPNMPQPGGFGDMGLRVTKSPDKITIIYPDDNTACTKTTDAVKYQGCYAELNVNDGSPYVKLTLPLNGATLSGTAFFTFQYSDLGTIIDAKVYLKNTGTGTINTVKSYTPNLQSATVSDSFDSSVYPDGNYEMYVTVTDNQGNPTTSDKIAVILKNQCLIENFNIERNTSDPLKDAITATGGYKLNGASTNATITLSAADGATTQTFGPLVSGDGTFNWTTNYVFGKTRDITVTATGKHGSCTAISTLTSKAPPFITITSPANGSEVSGTITLSFSAGDSDGINNANMNFNGQNCWKNWNFDPTNPATIPPDVNCVPVGVGTNFSCSVNYDTVANGCTNGDAWFNVNASDIFGNWVWDDVQFTINNGAGGGAFVEITNPALESTVSGNVNLSFKALIPVGAGWVINGFWGQGPVCNNIAPLEYNPSTWPGCTLAPDATNFNCSYSFDTTVCYNGSAWYNVQVDDVALMSYSDSANFYIYNPGKPGVIITNPDEGYSYSGSSITFSFSAIMPNPATDVWMNINGQNCWSNIIPLPFSPLAPSPGVSCTLNPDAKNFSCTTSFSTASCTSGNGWANVSVGDGTTNLSDNVNFTISK
jgi:prepilin-type N-terminal cleavage/methylation domain-containing protein